MPLQAKAISVESMAMALACKQRNFYKAAAQGAAASDLSNMEIIRRCRERRGC